MSTCIPPKISLCAPKGTYVSALIPLHAITTLVCSGLSTSFEPMDLVRPLLAVRPWGVALAEPLWASASSPFKGVMVRGGVQMVKNLPAMQETRVRSLGWEDPLEKGMATHSSILAWRIPWTEEPDGLQFTGSLRVGHDRVTNTHMVRCNEKQSSQAPRSPSCCFFLGHIIQLVGC